MILINENLKKLKSILLIIVIVLEICLFVLIMNLYTPVYQKTIELTKNYTINKTVSATKTLNDLLKISLYRYLLDLKLIGKHMAFLGNIEDQSKYIKKSSNFYNKILNNEDKINDELKKILVKSGIDLNDIEKKYYSELLKEASGGKNV